MSLPADLPALQPSSSGQKRGSTSGNSQERPFQAARDAAAHDHGARIIALHDGCAQQLREQFARKVSVKKLVDLLIQDTSVVKPWMQNSEGTWRAELCTTPEEATGKVLACLLHQEELEDEIELDVFNHGGGFD